MIKGVRGSKIVFMSFLFFGVVLIMSSFASAGFLGDWYGKITGKATSGSTSLNITIGNSAPTVINMWGNFSQNPSEGGTRTMILNFTASDTDGASNLNDSTAQLNLSRAGEVARINSSCVNVGSSGNNVNYSCTINMWYYDGGGAWTMNASVKDINGAMGENSTQSLTYNLLTSMVLSPSSLGWGSVGLSDTDTGSNTDPVLLNNTGNDADLSINVTGYDLQGEDTPGEYIYANNFTIENADPGCSGTAMSNATSINVTSTILQKGNYSINAGDDTSGQEEVYFCLKGVLPTISSQSYSSAGIGSWTVEIIT